MKDEASCRFRRGDAVAIAAVVLAALLMIVCFLIGTGSKQPVAAQVILDGKVIRELPLDTDQEITVEGHYVNTITVKGGRIAVTASNCPGEDCVHTGWLDQSGRSIVCLPNRLEIRLTGETTVDAVVQ